MFKTLRVEPCGMKTFIAFLRGINVGGKNVLPMKALVSTLESLKLHQVKTYIQSGNVIFKSDVANTNELSVGIGDAITTAYGFRPQILVLTTDDLQNAIAANPFPDAENDPKTLHLFFLDSVPTQPNTDNLNVIKKDSERFELIGTVFYLHAPEGISRAKLAAKVEKAMGVPTTARNWRSANKVLALALSL